MKKQDREQLVRILRRRFDENEQRHKTVTWQKVMAKLDASPTALTSLARMESTGGEPDVISPKTVTDVVTFCDCSAESPPGRRSLCYDQQAWRSRKENQPEGSAVEAAAAMGIELLSEEQYRALQQFGEFDAKTSSWIRTPHAIRALGGALFCDRRYGSVFVYHNGAQSYYAARGFRGLIRV